MFVCSSLKYSKLIITGIKHKALGRVFFTIKLEVKMQK